MTDEEVAAALVGHWARDPDDVRAKRAFGETTLKFTADGRFIQTIDLEGRTQVFRLTYHVDAGELVVNQPSSPREERLAFELTRDDRLVVHSPMPDGSTMRTYFLRVDDDVD